MTQKTFLSLFTVFIIFKPDSHTESVEQVSDIKAQLEIVP